MAKGSFSRCKKCYLLVYNAPALADVANVMTPAYKLEFIYKFYSSGLHELINHEKKLF